MSLRLTRVSSSDFIGYKMIVQWKCPSKVCFNSDTAERFSVTSVLRSRQQVVGKIVFLFEYAQYNIDFR